LQVGILIKPRAATGEVQDFASIWAAPEARQGKHANPTPTTIMRRSKVDLDETISPATYPTMPTQVATGNCKASLKRLAAKRRHDQGSQRRGRCRRVDRLGHDKGEQDIESDLAKHCLAANQDDQRSSIEKRQARGRLARPKDLTDKEVLQMLAACGLLASTSSSTHAAKHEQHADQASCTSGHLRSLQVRSNAPMSAAATAAA